MTMSTMVLDAVCLTVAYRVGHNRARVRRTRRPDPKTGQHTQYQTMRVRSRS